MVPTVMKDVVSCDKPRGGANILRSEDFRIGKPLHAKACKAPRKGSNFGLRDSVGQTTRGSETSQYPEEKKSNEIPLVAASERGIA